MRHRSRICIALMMVVLASGWAAAQELAPIQLPAPQTEGGRPLMQALKLGPSQIIAFAQCVGYPKN